MNAIASYEEQTITTQNRGRLVVLLYEGAIRFLRQALAASIAGHVQQHSQYIARAQDILLELNTVLDMEAGGTLAQNLRDLYTFLWQHLNRSNTGNNTQRIRQSITILNELLGGWKTIVAA
jgi:flagellar secretion chaperone FliS